MSEQIKLIALIKAKPGMTHEQFKERWIGKHAPITAQYKHLKAYRINIPIEEHHGDKSKLTYDGVAELVWDSYAEMQEDFNSELAKKAFADGDEFVLECVNLYSKEFIIK
jgi:uncharacterized protein (TIGR02118 family)